MPREAIPAAEEAEAELASLQAQVEAGELELEAARERARELQDLLLENPTMTQEDARALQALAAFLEDADGS